MRIIFLVLFALSIFQLTSYAEGTSDGYKKYLEKMEYWENRAKSAFQCKNRFELAMFLYDATFEEGTAPREELAMIIEFDTLENMDCVIESLKVLQKERVHKVLNRFYKNPLYKKSSEFDALIEKLYN